MKFFKIILAALVIFAAGVVTGGLLAKKNAPAPPPPADRAHQGGPPLPVSRERRQAFLDRLQEQLQLSPEQTSQIEKILTASQERMKNLWSPVEAQAKEEFLRTRKEISALLTPEQQVKHEEMLKRRHDRGKRDGDKDGDRDRERRRGDERKRERSSPEGDSNAPEAVKKDACACPLVSRS